MDFQKRRPCHHGRDRQEYYEPLIPVIRDAAWLQGYMAMVHGTMKRDLDIIAIPWIPMASTPQELANAIAEATGSPYEPGPPSIRPHGRLTWTIVLWNAPRTEEEQRAGYCPWIDLSVMPITINFPPKSES